MYLYLWQVKTKENFFAVVILEAKKKIADSGSGSVIEVLARIRGSGWIPLNVTNPEHCFNIIWIGS
jgi:hypothetical protein